MLQESSVFGQSAPAGATISLRRELAAGFPRVTGLRGVPYLEFLGSLHKTRNISRYLEVGTQWGLSLRLATGKSVAIDPAFLFNRKAPWAQNPGITLFEMTSDDYFHTNDPRDVLGGPIEMAFIDGMHLADFVLRDFANIEKYCAADSIIILHDAIPFNFEMTKRKNIAADRRDLTLANCWTGDVWRAGPILQRERPDLRIEAFDCPGTGLVIISNLDPANTRLAGRLAAITDDLKTNEASEAEFWSYIEALPVHQSQAVL